MYKLPHPLRYLGKKGPDHKVQGANMGPTWVLSAQDGLHVGPTNLAIREYIVIFTTYQHWISWLLGSFFLEDKNHWSMTAHVLATHITMTSYERHVVSNHRPFDCLFNGLCGPSSNKHQSPHYWPVNSPHQGPVTRKKLPFDDAIMKSYGRSSYSTYITIHTPL